MNVKNLDKKQTAFVFLTLIISFSFSLALAEWVLSYQRQSIENSDHMDAGMILYDAGLGWKLKPYWTGNHHHHDYDVSYEINPDGFRGSLADSQRLTNANSFAVVGDSFSFGLGVNDDQTFTSILNNNETNGHDHSFINYSVPGYSTDQQLLLIKKLGHKISKNVVLVVYLGNDIFDNMLPYPLQAEHAKPYFTLQTNELSLHNQPVPLTQKTAAARKTSIASLVLGEDYENGAFSRPLANLEISRRLGLFQNDIQLTEQSLQTRFDSSLELTARLIEEIKTLLAERQANLTVALLPGRSYVQSAGSLSAQYQEYFRRSLIRSLHDMGDIQLVDLATYLKSLSDDESKQLYYPNEGHLTAKGHEVVAEYLKTRLIQQ